VGSPDPQNIHFRDPISFSELIHSFCLLQSQKEKNALMKSIS
jgi:hypothetical protein